MFKVIKRHYAIVKAPPAAKYTKVQVIETVFSKVLEFYDDKKLSLDSNFTFDCHLDHWTRKSIYFECLDELEITSLNNYDMNHQSRDLQSPRELSEWLTAKLEERERLLF